MGGWVFFFDRSGGFLMSSGTPLRALYRARRDPNSYSNPGIRIVLLYIYEFMSSTAFSYCYFFKLLFLLSECDRTLPPLCYTQLNLFTNSTYAFYLKLVQNLHCVLVS